jgi:hypothetical protein
MQRAWMSQRKANVTLMRVEGGVDMLEQQQRRWPDWCEDQHSYASEHTGQWADSSSLMGTDTGPGRLCRREQRFEVETR